MISLEVHAHVTSRAIVVTGSFYSITTLLGTILSRSPRYNVIFEPTNFEPSPSYRMTGAEHWYEFYDESRYVELRAALLELMFGRGFGKEAVHRVRRIRSPRDAARIARLLNREPRYSARKTSSPIRAGKRNAFMRSRMSMFRPSWANSSPGHPAETASISRKARITSAAMRSGC